MQIRILKFNREGFAVLGNALEYQAEQDERQRGAALDMRKKVFEVYEKLKNADPHGKKLKLAITQDEFELCKQAAYAHNNFYIKEKPDLQDLTAALIQNLYKAKCKFIIER